MAQFNIYLVIVIGILLIAGMMFYYYYGIRLFKKSPATKTYVKTERGVIYFVGEHGLCLVQEIDEDTKQGWIKLTLRRPNGELLPEVQLLREGLRILNPGRPYETWIDLRLNINTEGIIESLRREKERADYHEREHMLVKANIQSEVDKRVDQAIELQNAKDKSKFLSLGGK